jgi:hypothetical protein
MEIFFHDELLREVFQTVAPFIKASNHQSDDRKVNRGPKKKRNTKQSIKKNKETRKQRNRLLTKRSRSLRKKLKPSLRSPR